MNFSSVAMADSEGLLGGKSRNLQAADGGRATVSAADEWCGVALMQGCPAGADNMRRDGHYQPK